MGANSYGGGYIYSTAAHGNPITYSVGRDRYSNANAAYRCADEHPDCDGYPNGQQCSLHAHCLARRTGRGGGGAAPR